MSGPEDKVGESIASEGLLSKPIGRSGTICASEAGGEAAGAAGAGAGGGCATCKGIAKYGTMGSKAG